MTPLLSCFIDLSDAEAMSAWADVNGEPKKEPKKQRPPLSEMNPNPSHINSQPDPRLAHHQGQCKQQQQQQQRRQHPGRQDATSARQESEARADLGTPASQPGDIAVDDGAPFSKILRVGTR